MNESTVTGKSKRIVGLDIMRGIGLFMVFFGHSKDLFLPFFPKAGYIGLLGKGALELFFSLSGFLIGTILINQFEQPGDWKRKLMRFFKRRWFRTLPLYYTGIIINLLAGIFITGNYFDFNWKFFVFSQNLREAAFFFFPISYSLSIEEWFYISFPVLLIALAFVSRRKVSSLMVMIALAVAVIAVLIRYDAYLSESVHWEANMRKGVMYRIDACIYGILMAVLFYRKKDLLLRLKWVLFGVGAFLYISAHLFYMLQHESVANYVFHFTLVPMAFALVIPLFYSIPDTGGLIVKIMVWASLLSFPLYIIHLNPMLEIVIKYVQINSIMQAWIVFFVYTIICVALAVILHIYIERPFMRYGKR